MYKLIKTIYSETPQGVINLENGTSIPFDPANTDYQAYLKWLEQGGVPIPADPLPAENT